MSQPLLRWEQQQSIKPLHPNFAGIGNQKYNLLSIEVEVLELSKMIGTSMLYDLQTNRTSAKYIDILESKTFNDRNGSTQRYNGIRYVLAYLNHSKYIGQSFVNESFNGVVRQKINESEPVGEGTIKRLKQESEEIALADFALIKEYLIINKETYPLFANYKSVEPKSLNFWGVKKYGN